MLFAFQSHGRIPGYQVQAQLGRQARYQGEMGQVERYCQQDLWLHPRQGHRLRCPVRQPGESPNGRNWLLNINQLLLS